MHAGQSHGGSLAAYVWLHLQIVHGIAQCLDLKLHEVGGLFCSGLHRKVFYLAREKMNVQEAMSR